MDLWYSTTSPFARKVRIAARELRLDDRITPIVINPWTSADLRALNPLAKVPTLVLEDGRVLFESSVICDYLDSLAPERRIIPQSGPARHEALLLQGLADGAMTAAGRLFANENRSPDQRSAAMMQRFAEARDAALAWLEDRALGKGPTIGEISVATCLGYLDFRWPERDWRSAHPKLADWFAAMAQRPSLQGTAHSA